MYCKRANNERMASDDKTAADWNVTLNTPTIKPMEHKSDTSVE